MAHHKTISPYYKAIWFLYLLFATYYFLDSGYPQPADAIIVLGLLPALISVFLRKNIKTNHVFWAGGAFVLLTFTINMIHFVFMPDKRFFLSSIYYVYNFGVFLFVAFLFSRAPQKINRITYIGLAFSIIIQLCFVLFTQSEGPRAEGSFNNPNQLGYWCLLSLALLIVVKRDQKLNLFDMGLIFCTFFMQLLSLSKAGIIAMMFCAGILFLSHNVSHKQRIGAIAVIAIVIINIAAFNPNLFRVIANLDIIDATYTRLSTIGTQGDDSISGRGYDRILDNPEYVLLGSGEGGFIRYNPKAQELHSGLATLIFSYGIIGFSTFFLFLYFAFRGRPWRHILLLIPIMLYGLTHQNIRNTYFWVVVAAAYSGRYFVEETYNKENLLLNNANVGKAPPRK